MYLQTERERAEQLIGTVRHEQRIASIETSGNFKQLVGNELLLITILSTNFWFLSLCIQKSYFHRS